jgi:hypothetical protein
MFIAHDRFINDAVFGTSYCHVTCYTIREAKPYDRRIKNSKLRREELITGIIPLNITFLTL